MCVCWEVGIPFDNPIPVNIESASALHSIPYVTPSSSVQAPLPLSVFSDSEYVPIRAKIQTSELSFNGTLLLNREDLYRALNFQQYTIQEHN